MVWRGRAETNPRIVNYLYARFGVNAASHFPLVLVVLAAAAATGPRIIVVIVSSDGVLGPRRRFRSTVLAVLSTIDIVVFVGGCERETNSPR